MSIKINCLCCGHVVDLDDAYNDYDGAIRCYACSAMLHVTLSDGNIKSVMVAERALTGKGRNGQSEIGQGVMAGVNG